jgi:hypothetical protein
MRAPARSPRASLLFLHETTSAALPALSCFRLRPGTRAEWLTLTGSPGDADHSYVQVDPTSVQVDGAHRIVKLRLSLAQTRTTRDGMRSARSMPR